MSAVRARGSDLARRIGLSFAVLSPAIELLKTQHQVQIVGGGLVGGASYRYYLLWITDPNTRAHVNEIRAG